LEEDTQIKVDHVAKHLDACGLKQRWMLRGGEDELDNVSRGSATFKELSPLMAIQVVEDAQNGNAYFLRDWRSRLVREIDIYYLIH